MGHVKMSKKIPALTVPIILEPILNDNTWEMIRAASDAGIAATLWSVGDCKEIVLNGTIGNTEFTNYKTYAFIVGFDHNADLEGACRIHFQIGKTEDGTDIALCDSAYGTAVSKTGYFSMNASDVSAGGWEASQMRANICAGFSGIVSDDLRAVLKTVTKYTDNTGGGSGSDESFVTATTDYFFLPSEYEVKGSIAYGNTYEEVYQKQYAYYAAGNSRVKYKHGDTSTTSAWHLRTPRATSDGRFAYVHSDGRVMGLLASNSRGIAPIFCV